VAASSTAASCNRQTVIKRPLMRIAITADPELPVPPQLYGGIERIIDLLVRGLVTLEHDVTLFAHPESTTSGKLIPYCGRSSTSWSDTLRNSALIAQHVLGGGYDVVHSFSRLAYLAPLLPLALPKLMTYQRQITRRSVAAAHLLSRGSLQFSATSRKMIAPVADVGSWHLVYNGVSLASYNFAPVVAVDAPLVFLGRIEHIKGTHLAIQVARRAGLPLVIAGNIPSAHRGYFEREIQPWLDGSSVTYVGPVDDTQKNYLLGRARAFLMPILWEEPFGIVMAEALACGTPVIGLDRGAVSEIVNDGITGFVRGDVDGLVIAATRISEIDRAACRDAAERLFSGDAVVTGYLDVYSKLRRVRTGGRFEHSK
jgi:glycosyltransferase involved in cell wall biosynthesis